MSCLATWFCYDVPILCVYLQDTVTPSVKASIALQAARGMEYLHSQGVVHFDLKGENLLCDLRDLARPVVKVGGWMSAFFASALSHKWKRRPHPAWMSTGSLGVRVGCGV